MSTLELYLPLACFLMMFGLWHHYNHSGPDARARHAEALRRFFERTEYRVIGLEHLPLDVQARMWIESEHGRPHVRELDEGRLLFSRSLPPGSTPRDLGVGRPGWVLELRRPVRVEWGLVESHHFEVEDAPARPGPRVPLDDRELGRRCHLYGADAWAVRVILQSPELRESLRACADIELHVTRDRILFVDPQCRNIHAGAGGVIAMMATPIEHAYDAQIAVHEQIAGLLARAARASREVV